MVTLPERSDATLDDGIMNIGLRPGVDRIERERGVRVRFISLYDEALLHLDDNNEQHNRASSQEKSQL